MTSAHVSLIMQDKEKDKEIERLRRLLGEEEAKNGMLHDKEKSVTSELVKYIRGDAKWAAHCKQLASEKQRLKEMMEEERFVLFALKYN